MGMMMARAAPPGQAFGLRVQKIQRVQRVQRVVVVAAAACTANMIGRSTSDAPIIVSRFPFRGSNKVVVTCSAVFP